MADYPLLFLDRLHPGRTNNRERTLETARTKRTTKRILLPCLLRSFQSLSSFRPCSYRTFPLVSASRARPSQGEEREDGQHGRSLPRRLAVIVHADRLKGGWAK